jgi:hypothetical protein
MLLCKEADIAQGCKAEIEHRLKNSKSVLDKLKRQRVALDKHIARQRVSAKLASEAYGVAPSSKLVLAELELPEACSDLVELVARSAELREVRFRRRPGPFQRA